MKLTNEFTVPAPVEQAWAVLLDLERVAPCLPGAALEGRDGDEHRGTMTIKVGPITSRYGGSVRVEQADEAARRAVMRARAKDARGHGTASATITSTMRSVPEGTRVGVETELRVTGPAAQFGRGVMQDVSAKLMRRFAECLAEEMRAEPAAVATEGSPGGTRPTAGNEATLADSGLTAPGTTTGAGLRGPTVPGAVEQTAVGPLPTGPAGDAAEEAAAGGGRAAAAAPASAPRRAAEVLDLGEASREAVLKRVAPVAAGALGLALAIALVRRRR